MGSWISSRSRKRVAATGLVLVSLLSAGLLVYRYGDGAPPEVRDRAVLEDLRERLRHEPFDPGLLLRSARSHYGYVRYRLRREDAGVESVRPLIERGLAHYRRLLAAATSYLHRRDYFYAAYLYHQLGVPYDDRAQTMALKAYDGGYRTPELITLLANLHYRSGEYDVALNFYRSLGTNLRDPVLVYNKAMTLRAMGESGRARTLLRERMNRSDLSLSDALGRRYYRALVRLEIDRENPRRALAMIDELPASDRDLQLRTLRARALIQMGELSRARGELESVVKHASPPRRARALLRELSEPSDERRS